MTYLVIVVKKLIDNNINTNNNINNESSTKNINEKFLELNFDKLIDYLKNKESSMSPNSANTTNNNINNDVNINNSSNNYNNDRRFNKLSKTKEILYNKKYDMKDYEDIKYKMYLKKEYLLKEIKEKSFQRQIAKILASQEKTLLNKSKSEKFFIKMSNYLSKKLNIPKNKLLFDTT